MVREPGSAPAVTLSPFASEAQAWPSICAVNAPLPPPPGPVGLLSPPPPQAAAKPNPATATVIHRRQCVIYPPGKRLVLRLLPRNTVHGPTPTSNVPLVITSGVVAGLPATGCSVALMVPFTRVAEMLVIVMVPASLPVDPPPQQQWAASPPLCPALMIRTAPVLLSV